jgi:hypothetical protein
MDGSHWLSHPLRPDAAQATGSGMAVLLPVLRGRLQTRQCQRVLTPGDIAGLPDGHGLLLRSTDWELLRLTRWYQSEPWRTVARCAGMIWALSSGWSTITLGPSPAKEPLGSAVQAAS